MSNLIIPQMPTNGQSLKADQFVAAFDLPTDRPNRAITKNEALQIARLALAAILFGEPDPITFDRSDLCQSLTLLAEIGQDIRGQL